MQTLTVSVIDSLNLKPLENFISWVTVSSGLNRNFLQVIRLQWREFEKMKEWFLKTWKNERKVLLTSKNLKKGSWIAAPLPCTSVLWGQKMKNKNRKKLPLFKDGCFFFPLESAILATVAILLLLYFAGTHNSMTSHESSDWRRVVTKTKFLLATSNFKSIKKGFDLVRIYKKKTTRLLTDPASGTCEAQNLWGRPNNRNRVQGNIVFSQCVKHFLKHPGFEATVLWRIHFLRLPESRLGFGIAETVACRNPESGAATYIPSLLLFTSSAT